MANYGSPPYEESTFRKALRMLTIGAAGWGAVRPGSNFGEAFLSAGGRSALAAQQASQAAQDYALRQQEAQRRREEDLAQAEWRKADIEIRTKQAGAEKVPTKRQDYEDLIGQGVGALEARQIVYGLTAEEQYSQKEKERAAKAAETGEEPELSGAALNIAAEVYLKTGQLPSMGMGKSGVKNRTRILNRASEMRPGADVAGNTASFRSNQRSLVDLRLQKNRLQSFENTAAENTKIIWDFIDKVPDTGTRFGNKWSRWLANQSGNPDVASFMAAVNVVMNEYARIVTQFGGTNIMTDTARKEMERIISGDFTKKQLIAVMQTIQRDASNRLKSTDQQIRSIEGGIGGMLDVPSDSTGHADLIYNPRTGELEPAR